MASGGSFRFGPFELDVDTRSLVKGSDEIHIERQVFEVILHLIAHRDRVVSKIELIDEIWGDRFVSESALTSRIKSARQALDDDGRKQNVIGTVHGVGYRFLADVVELDDVATDSIDLDEPAEHQFVSLAPLKPFIGRQDDIDHVESRLTEQRMLTVVGPGGVGKTHLLRVIGDRLGHTFEQPPILLRLSEVADGNAIGDLLLDAMGAAQQSGVSAIDSALRYLGNRRLLLLIDNAEHLRADVANLARSILYRCPSVQLLVTSRQRLNVIGENVFLLAPLRPEDGLALFVEHAASHGLRLDPDRQDVRELCERLDGVPLAIELLAARAPMLSIADLHRHLAIHLSVSIHNEESGRHGSVEAALAWSLAELGEADRRLLADLSCAVGPFGLDAALALAGDEDAAGQLIGLCERSLVVAEPDAARSRFRLLEPIRLFVSGSEDRRISSLRRHVAHYVQVAEDMGDQMRWSPQIDEAIDELRSEWSNLRAAFDYADELDDLASMSRLVRAVIDMAELRLMFEVERWAARVIERFDEPHALSTELQDEVLAARARLASHRFDLSLTAELVAQLSDSNESTTVTTAKVWDAFYAARSQETKEFIVSILEQASGTGGLRESGALILEVYRARSYGDDSSAAHARLIEAGANGGPTARVFAQIAVGSNTWYNALDAAAIEDLERAVALSTELGHALLIGAASSFRSIVLASTQDRYRALVGLREQLEYLASVGLWSVLLADLPMTVKVLADVDENKLAGRLLGLRHSRGYVAGASQLIAEMMAAVLDERLGSARLDELMEEGAKMEIDQAVQLALGAIETHLPTRVA